MGNELVTQPSIRSNIEQIHGIAEIEHIIDECLPVACAQQQGVSEALILAKGVALLREFFLSNEAVKATIMAVSNTRLGFVTDRSQKAIASAKASGKTLVAYSYEQIAECCIEALLSGYRLTGNEFNIIADNFYPAKNGKYRRIIDTSGLTNFKFGNTTPSAFNSEQRGAYKSNFMSISCWASWTLHGVQATEEKLDLRIKVNSGMGDDAIVGKALSKLFSRVLMQLTGQLLPESTDIAEEEIVQLENKSEIKAANPFEDKKTLTELQQKVKDASSMVDLKKLAKELKLQKSIVDLIEIQAWDKLENETCIVLVNKASNEMDKAAS